MTAALGVFYADSHHGNAFGVHGPLYGPAGHRGDDTHGWDVGTLIPTIVEGVVTRSERQSGLGWVLSVRCERLGIWVMWCHMESQGLAVGAEVTLGQGIGPLGNTGRLSAGAHVHVCVSLSGDNPATSSVIDPRPFIVAARGTTAADQSKKPIDNTPERKEFSMLGYIAKDGNATETDYLTSDASQGVRINEGWCFVQQPGQPLVRLYSLAEQTSARQNGIELMPAKSGEISELIKRFGDQAHAVR